MVGEGRFFDDYCDFSQISRHNFGVHGKKWLSTCLDNC